MQTLIVQTYWNFNAAKTWTYQRTSSRASSRQFTSLRYQEIREPLDIHSSQPWIVWKWLLCI